MSEQIMVQQRVQRFEPDRQVLVWAICLEAAASPFDQSDDQPASAAERRLSQTLNGCSRAVHLPRATSASGRIRDFEPCP